MIVLILFICTASFCVSQAPTFFERRKDGILGN